jgi:hypothetical protein
MIICVMMMMMMKRRSRTRGCDGKRAIRFSLPLPQCGHHLANGGRIDVSIGDNWKLRSVEESSAVFPL